MGIWTAGVESSITCPVTIVGTCLHRSPVTREMVCIWNKSAAGLQVGYLEFWTWSSFRKRFCPFRGVGLAVWVSELQVSLSLLCARQTPHLGIHWQYSTNDCLLAHIYWANSPAVQSKHFTAGNWCWKDKRNTIDVCIYKQEPILS